MLLVDQILAPKDCNSTLGNILFNIKELMSCFMNFKIIYDSRAFNSAAYKLARNTSWHVNDYMVRRYAYFLGAYFTVGQVNYVIC